MERNAQPTVQAALAICLDYKLLRLTVIEARLTVKLVAIVTDIKCDRAAILALEVGEFVSVQLTDFFSISEVRLRANPTNKLGSVHVFSHHGIVVILATIVDPQALIAVI